MCGTVIWSTECGLCGEQIVHGIIEKARRTHRRDRGRWIVDQETGLVGLGVKPPLRRSAHGEQLLDRGVGPQRFRVQPGE